MTAVDISTVLVHDDMVARLVDLLNAATDEAWQEGTYWYARAHAAAVGIADEYNVSVETAAGVIAALSPRLPWAKNVEYAHRVFRDGTAPVLYTNRDKAIRIARGEHPTEVLSGAKVKAFYQCILSPITDAVCIDRHAIDAALGYKGDDTSRKVLDRKGAYDMVVWAYIAAAEHFGIGPAQCQAIAWVAWRA